MSGQNIDFSLMEFSRNLVTAVNQVLFPEDAAIKIVKPDVLELSIPLETILGRYKLELYFLFIEEIACYQNPLNELNFKELMEKLTCDMKVEKYDSELFSWFCVLVSYYASVADKRNGITAAFRLGARAVYDTIQNCEKKDGIVKDINNTLTEMGRRIIAQKISDAEKVAEMLKTEDDFVKNLMV